MQIVETTGLPVSAEKEAHSSEPEPHTRMGDRDPLYLFACLLEWKHSGKLEAYQELIAALDDPREEIRVVAECLLQRSSPRPHDHRLCAK
jgi:hypothetical protein